MSTWMQFALPLSSEILILFVALYCVYSAQKNRIYPALWQLLIFWTASDTLLLGEGFVRHLHLIGGVQAYQIYSRTYWPVFAINTILILRVLHEMFRHAVRSIPGVQKLGRPIFFWAIVVSVILAFASGIGPHTHGVDFIASAGQVLMRSQAVLSLCMVTFLVFASQTLGVSYNSRIFGVTFGFALMAIANLINAAILTNNPNIVSTANTILEVVNIAAIGIWAVYFLKPEPARRLVTMPVTSPLVRWNEIAQTLGNPAGQVALSYPPSFLTDAMELVNQVMGPLEPARWPQKAMGRPPGPIAS